MRYGKRHRFILKQKKPVLTPVLIGYAATKQHNNQQETLQMKRNNQTHYSKSLSDLKSFTAFIINYFPYCLNIKQIN